MLRQPDRRWIPPEPGAPGSEEWNAIQYLEQERELHAADPPEPRLSQEALANTVPKMMVRAAMTPADVEEHLAELNGLIAFLGAKKTAAV